VSITDRPADRPLTATATNVDMVSAVDTVVAVDSAVVDALCRRVADIPGDVHDIVRRHVGSVAPLLHGIQRERLVAATVARLAGLDGLDVLMADPSIDEILVNRGGEVWIERHGVLELAEPIPAEAVPIVLERVLAPLGRRLDRTNPIVDARLPDGSRVCAVIEPVAVDGTAIAVRRLRRRCLTLEEFCPTPVAAMLREVLDARCNMVVTGATSSGKTSLLAAMLGMLAIHERVVVLEDTAELGRPDGHVVRLEARSSTADGVRAVPMHELVRTALRLRPDRLVVGEVRGDEVLAMVQAMNTGHDGSLSTCHANSPVDALARLETLIMQAAPNWPLAAIRSQLARSIDVIVHLGRTGSAARRVVAVAEVVEGDGPPVVRPLTDHRHVVAPLRRVRRRST
jgi:pilus assembly protein CpaF